MLLDTAEPPELGPGPRDDVRSEWELNQELERLLCAAKLPETSRELIRSLVLLWHDHLDAAHTIYQSIEAPDGSFLHAIMHRREPDYWNSKYWWQRTGRHPCFAALGKRVAALLDLRHERELCGQLISRGEWDAGAFVDVCEAAAREAKSSKRVNLLREIQRIETEVALEHLLRAA